MLADSTFLPSLKNFDKDNIDAKIIDKIRVFLQIPEFAPEVVKKASKAAYGLCCWVRAMESYDRVAKVHQIETSHVVTFRAKLVLNTRSYNAATDRCIPTQPSPASLEAIANGDGIRFLTLPSTTLGRSEHIP